MMNPSNMQNAMSMMQQMQGGGMGGVPPSEGVAQPSV
jgi:hypothetical protein